MLARRRRESRNESWLLRCSALPLLRCFALSSSSSSSSSFNRGGREELLHGLLRGVDVERAIRFLIGSLVHQRSHGVKHHRERLCARVDKFHCVRGAEVARVEPHRGGFDVKNHRLPVMDRGNCVGGVHCQNRKRRERACPDALLVNDRDHHDVLIRPRAFFMNVKGLLPTRRECAPFVKPAE